MWKQLILESLQGIIGVAITVLLAFIRKKYSQYVNTDTKKKLVNDTVYYVEQVFNDLHGKEKLDKAKTTLAKLLAEKGIGFTEEELTVLIESTVNQLNLQQLNSISLPIISDENCIDPCFFVEPTIDNTVDTDTIIDNTVNLTEDNAPKG